MIIDNIKEKECKRCTHQFIINANNNSLLTRIITYIFTAIIMGISREAFDGMSKECKSCVKPHKKALLKKSWIIRLLHKYIDPFYDKLIRKYGDEQINIPYTTHLFLNFKVAMKCLILFIFHLLHGIFPFDVTNHEHWKIYSK